MISNFTHFQCAISLQVDKLFCPSLGCLNCTKSKCTAEPGGVCVPAWWDLLPELRSCSQTPGAGVTAQHCHGHCSAAASVQHFSIVPLGNTTFAFARCGKHMNKMSELWLEKHCQQRRRCRGVRSCGDSQVPWLLVAAADNCCALPCLWWDGFLGKSWAALEALILLLPVVSLMLCG